MKNGGLSAGPDSVVESLLLKAPEAERVSKDQNTAFAFCYTLTFEYNLYL
jgi:hypothetical protein